MTKPLVTITMGTYNRPLWVREAIQSVYRQEFPDWEIILINDGGCPVDISGFDKKLKYIHRSQNMGFAYTLNEAIQHAQGEYIAYLGDDDKMYPHHLYTLIDAIQGFEGDVVYSDLYKVYCKIDNQDRHIIKKCNEISRDFDRKMILHMNHTLGGAMLHTKKILDKTGGYTAGFPVYIDWDMTRRMSFYTDFLHVPKITGEFYAGINKSDRISVKQRKNKHAYESNVNNVKRNNPLAPWPKVKSLTEYGRDKLMFDSLYHTAQDYDEHTPIIAAKIYKHLRKNYNNENWMKTREAHSLYKSGIFVEAYKLISEVNDIMPTTETLRIAANCLQGIGHTKLALEYIEIIKNINGNKVYWDDKWKELK